MRIKKLELQGFKSFPEKTRIVFHKGITSIIGPNGTGKSNIVDALLWVLGGKRLKSFRGEHRGNIIFNGSTDKAPMGMAYVTLTLTDEEEEMHVSHRIFRSGEGEYRLDGKAVRLRDIQEALWQKSIGESEYFVIEQGAIGQFLSSKPLEKRGLLEEAAGTSLYKDKKRQAHNKLNNSEQNLTRLEDIIAEVSRAKNSLKRQAAAAIRYRQLREGIRKLTSLSFRKKIDDLENDIRNISVSHQKSMDKEKAVVHQLKDAEKLLSEKRQDMWSLENRIKDGQEHLYDLRSRIAGLEADKDREEKRIDYLEEKKKGAKNSDKEFELELYGLEKDKIEAEEKLKAHRHELDLKQEELKKAEHRSEEARAKLEERQKKIDSIRDAYFQKISEQTHINNEKARLEKELELMQRQEEKLSTQISEEHKELKEKSSKQNEAEKSISRKKDDLKILTEKIDLAEKVKNELDKDISNLERRLAELQKTRDKNSHHLDVLEKLEAAERGKDKGGEIPDTIGLLADFLESDREHAGLVDIFWKEEAKSHLIHAERFLNDLTDAGIKGRFLLLHPEESRGSSSEVFKHPSAIGRLKSFVRPNAKIKKHFSHLKEAVITQDIKSAIELWLQYPASDYITLSGDLLYSSGFLKLGEKKEGLFAINQEIKSVRKQISEVEKKIVPVQQNIADKTAERNRQDSELADAISQADRSSRDIEDMEKDLQFDQTDTLKIKTTFTILSKELDVLSQDKTALFYKLESITSQVSIIQTGETTLKKNLETAENTITELHKNSDQERKLFFELKSQVDLLSEKISSYKQRLELYDRRKETISNKKTSLSDVINNAEKEKICLKENILKISQNISAAIADKKEKEDLLHIDKTKLNEMQQELKAEEAKIDGSRIQSEKQKEDRQAWEIKKAEMDRDLVNLEESCWQELKKTLNEVKSDVSLEDLEKLEVESSLSEANEKLQRISSVNLMAEEEYLIQKKRHDFLVQEQEDLHKSIDATREAIKKIDQESRIQFLHALKEVNKNFKDVFSILFEGGNAEVKLSDPGNPLESGVEIVAQPPGKRVHSLNLLSGGEKSLTSLAFFFALFRYKPAPFCILDEVDAALDESNLGRFLNLMKKIKDQTQFIIVTHNFKTMEVADFIYGTTMADPSITNIYSVKMDPKTNNLKRIN